MDINKYTNKINISVFDSLYEESKKTSLTKYSDFFEKLVPQWILDETDELLLSYLKHLSHLYLTYKQQNNYVYELDINKTDLLLIEIFYSLGLDKYLQNNLDLNKLQYFKSFVSAFLKIRKFRGEERALNIFFTFLGLKIKKIRRYVGSLYNDNIYSEQEKIEEDTSLTLDEFYNKYPPLAIFDIILQEIDNDKVASQWANGFWFTPLPSFLNLDKMIEEMIPYHAEFKGLFTELDGKSFSAFDVVCDLIITTIIIAYIYANYETKLYKFVNFWNENLSDIYSYPQVYCDYDWSSIPSINDILTIIEETLIVAYAKIITLPSGVNNIYTLYPIGSNFNKKNYTFILYPIGSNFNKKNYIFTLYPIGSSLSQ